MNRGRALFERNAAACESAKFPSCKCACGGALHGVKHSVQWRAETWRKLEAAEAERLEAQAAQETLAL